MKYKVHVLYLRRFLPGAGQEVNEGVSVAAVQTVRLLLPGHRDLVHVLAQLDLWLVIHRDQLEDATQRWLSLACHKVGSWNSLINLWPPLDVRGKPFIWQLWSNLYVIKEETD